MATMWPEYAETVEKGDPEPSPPMSRLVLWGWPLATQRRWISQYTYNALVSEGFHFTVLKEKTE